MRIAAAICVAALAVSATPAFAQIDSDVFVDGKDGAKVHSASGFVCPLSVGSFERDSVGEADPETSADFCAYSALDGVYGTITLKPLNGPYDATASLSSQFAEQEGSAGQLVGEGTQKFGIKGKPAIAVYTRTYGTASLADLHYRVLFAGGVVGQWAVEATIEYADPRDTELEQGFLNAVYAAALAKIGPAPGATTQALAGPQAPPPLAGKPPSR
jgi:hypothetical protein